jgi:hypothetical protein
MHRIFVTYRRDDSQADAGRICDHLVDRFGRNQVFFDIDTIPPGEDFVQYLQAKVSECDVLVAVIGKHWLAATDEQGTRRLDNPNDFVRLEIAGALKRNIPVFPILVDGADMPRAQDLPDELAALSRQQAIELRQVGFRQQLQLLFQAIEEKRREQRRARRPRIFRSAPALSRTGSIAIAGLCVLAFVAVYLARHHQIKQTSYTPPINSAQDDSTKPSAPSIKLAQDDSTEPSAPSNGGQNMLIQCIPACTANTDFTLRVTNVGPTSLSAESPSGIAILGVLLPEPASLRSWTLTADGNLPIFSGYGVAGYNSGNVFPLFKRSATAPKNFKTFQTLSARAGAKVTSYNAFAFGLGSFNTSGASVDPVRFSGFDGGSGFPPGTIFFAFLADNNSNGKVVDQTPNENIVVVTNPH